MSVGMSILPRVCSAFISNNIYSIRIKKKLSEFNIEKPLWVFCR